MAIELILRVKSYFTLVVFTVFKNRDYMLHITYDVFFSDLCHIRNLHAEQATQWITVEPIYGRLPTQMAIYTSMLSLKTGGHCWPVQLHWNIGPSARNVWPSQERQSVIAVVSQGRCHCTILWHLHVFLLSVLISRVWVLLFNFQILFAVVRVLLPLMLPGRPAIPYYLQL